MFVTIRRYSPKNGAITKASLELLRRQIHDEFIPKAETIPGFRGYYVVNVENRELITSTRRSMGPRSVPAVRPSTRSEIH